MSSVYLPITEAQLERLKPPREGIAYYRDTALAGFGVKVTSNGVKAFFIEARVRGKDRTRRKVLGRHPDTRVDAARSLALVHLAAFGQGHDPIADERELRADDHNPTLRRVLDDYLAAKPLKPATMADYEKVAKWAFTDWFPRPMREIDRDLVAKRHQALGKKSAAQANYAMRLLRALFNYSIESYRGPRGKAVITDNPVLLLSRVKAWHRVQRRRTVIKRHELRPWLDAVDGLRGERGAVRAEVAADYLRFLLFTGARRSEAAHLRRAHVDLQDRSFVFVETKNWSDHGLPMSEPVWDILARRMDAGGDWLFPAGDDKPISDVRWWIGKVAAASGVPFVLHDLRRTFGTVAESLDLSHYTIKRLLNHTISDADVTSGYLVLDVERLRDPAQRIADRILSLASLSAAA